MGRQTAPKLGQGSLEQHLPPVVLAQAGGEGTAGRPGPNDYGVVGLAGPHQPPGPGRRGGAPSTVRST
ncbi:MAG TPA: hypothetical protein VEN99_03975, partial [Acidimicrobiia bacterium]|nr:hypothetical protein [Acidimicrobiia bacterium]